MFKGTHLNKHKFINQLLTTSNNFYFFTKSRNILSKSTNISKINNNHSITSYQNHTLTNISNSLHKKKKSFSIKKIHNVKLKMKKPSSHTKQPNIKSFSLRNNNNYLHKIHHTHISVVQLLLNHVRYQTSFSWVYRITV